MQRRAMIGTGLAATAVALTGCGRTSTQGEAGGAPSAISSGKATGTVTMWAMGNEGKLLPDFVKTFEQANPGVTVQVTAIPWDSAQQKFQTAIAAGTPPDVAMMPGMPVFKDAYAPVPEGIDVSGMYEGAIATGRMGGRQLQVPWYVDTRVLYYRTDLAEKAGWSKPPQTWDQLQTFTSDLQSKAGARWGIRLPAGGEGTFQNTLWLPWSNGAELMNADQSAWTLDTPQMAGAYRYLQTFFTDKIANTNVDPASDAAVHDFVTGATPSLVGGPFLASLLTQTGGKGFAQKFATATVPKGKSSTSFVGGANLTVFKDAKNPDAAWKLIQWLSQAPTQVSWYKVSGDLPAAEAAWHDPALTEQENLDAFATQLKTAKAPPQIVAFDQVGAVADTSLERIIKKHADPAAELAKLQTRAEQIGVK